MSLEPTDFIITIDSDDRSSKLLAEATQLKSLYFSSAIELERHFDKWKPHAVFIEISIALADNGLELLSKTRSAWPFAPVILMVKENDEDATATVLASGANDFIFKPINTSEVGARMRTRIAELAKKKSEELIHIGDLVLDLNHRVISNDNKQKRFLSPTEINIINCLIASQGTIVRREVMKKVCWGQIFVSDNALNRKLHEVRRTIKELSAEVNIRTLYGTGFILEVKNSKNLHDKKPHTFKKSA